MKEKHEYKFGIIMRLESNWRKTKRVCNCGQILIGSHKQCDKCGNDYFVDCTGRENQTRFTIPYLEAVRKDNRGFKVYRTNLSIIQDRELCTVEPVKENLRRTIEFDLIDKVLKVWRNDELEYDIHSNINNSKQVNVLFFKELRMFDFLEFVSNDTTRDIYTNMVFKLSRTTEYSGWTQKTYYNILEGLGNYLDHQWVQILATSGIPEPSRFFDNPQGNRWNKPSNVVAVDKSKTKPHEILKVPKFMIKYIREDTSFNCYNIASFQKYLNEFEGNKMKELMSIINDESSFEKVSNSFETLLQIHRDYGYDNLKKLTLYLCREIKMYQGIPNFSDGVTLMRDYIRMSKALDRPIEKYPKSLKKEHDVVNMDYSLIMNDAKTRKLFNETIGSSVYKSYEYDDKKKKMAILSPKSLDDLIKEGNDLSHCVSSYVGDINSDRCKIFFLRNMEDVEEPFVTIETRGMNIRQVKGIRNSDPSINSKAFISEWAKEKNLYEAYY